MNAALFRLFPLLTQALQQGLEALDSATLDQVEEVHLRLLRPVSVSVNGKRLFIGKKGFCTDGNSALCYTKEELDKFLYRFCDGSVYAYEDCLKQGFITAKGIRAGLSGRGLLNNDHVMGFKEIDGINLRFPKHISGCSKALLQALSQEPPQTVRGVLIASAPGVGKTTVLRDLAVTLSRTGTDVTRFSSPYSICVIDERSEIFLPEVFDGCLADFYTGIPKSLALEYAVRVMAPDIVICDEIGVADERALRQAHVGGVFLVASVHALSLADIRHSSGLRGLFEEQIFSHVYVLTRNGETRIGKLYPFTPSEETDEED